MFRPIVGSSHSLDKTMPWYAFNAGRKLTPCASFRTRNFVLRRPGRRIRRPWFGSFQSGWGAIHGSFRFGRISKNRGITPGFDHQNQIRPPFDTQARGILVRLAALEPPIGHLGCPGRGSDRRSEPFEEIRFNGKAQSTVVERIPQRAAVDIQDDFRAGLSQWTGPAG